MSANANRAILCVVASYVIGLGVFFAPWVFGVTISEGREAPWLGTILGTTVVLNILAFRYGRGVAPGARFFAGLGLCGDAALLVIWILASGLAVR